MAAPLGCRHSANALVYLRHGVRLAGNPRNLDLHLGCRLESAKPGPIRYAAEHVELDVDVAFQIGDYSAEARFGRSRPMDPDEGFLSRSDGCSLLQTAVAPQQPDFIGAFLPLIGGVGRKENRLDGIGRRHGHRREARDGRR